MINTEEYVKTQSREERTDHIDLSTPCHIYGKERRPHIYRQSLSEYLNTDLPQGNHIHACHACNNKLCNNPEHLYWGTPEENRKDLEDMFLNAYGVDGIRYLDGMINYVKMAQLIRYAELVRKGQVHEIIIDESRKIRHRKKGSFKVEGKTIRVEIPEGKKYFYAQYEIKQNPHPLAKPKKFKTSTKTDDFHTACVIAYMLHSSDRWGKTVSSREAEDWIVGCSGLRRDIVGESGK
jgi:hypothetical protein